MQINITDWALSSYIDMLDKGVFTRETFQQVIRPDVLMLKEGVMYNPRFENGKFWGHATYNGRIISNGWKMKWHNFGNGRVQVRLAVAIIKGECFLCQGYVKRDEKVDQKEMALFMNRIQKITLNRNIIIRGTL